ncbi:MAG: DUF6912 family protein [Nocardioidaceae bacterium]
MTDGGPLRVYLPGDEATLTALRDTGELSMVDGFAVTEELRSVLPDADDEQLEYAALSAAADASLLLLAAAAEPAHRRIVVAADVESLEEAPDEHVAAVHLDRPVRLSAVAAIHVDDPADAGLVHAAVEALPAAILGDPDGRAAVDALADQELSWYATQELDGL